MRRLLIVDDEPFIVNGLASLCSGMEQIDIEVYTAYSTSEALNWLKRTKIDIVLSDIRMPGMSGLALQKEILKQWPRCKVIFLTGHDDFAYIQEATRCGSVDYILKTEGNSAVLRALEKTSRLLEEEMEASSLITKAREQMKTALPFLQKQYVLDLLHSEPGCLQDIERQLAELNIELDSRSPSMLLLCRIDNWNENAAPADRALLLYAVQNIVEEFMRPMALTMGIEFTRSKIIWLLQPVMEEGTQATEPEEDVRIRTMRFIHGTLEQIQAVCKDLLKLQISFAATSDWAAWERLAGKFEELKLLLGSGLGIGMESLLIENSRVPVGDKPASLERRFGLPAKKIELLRSCLDNGESNEFFRVFTETAESCSRLNSCKDSLMTMEFYYAMVSLLLPYITPSGSVGSGNTESRIEVARLTRFEDHEAWKEAVDYLAGVAGMIFEQKEKGKFAQEHEVITKVKLYIEEHLSGDLSLTQIGEAVGHNPSYLSRLYKQTTGEGLSESINAARLARAKRLLLETTDKIHEIAAAVGFVSPPYFYRFFKKATHLTPQEYRDSENK